MKLDNFLQNTWHSLVAHQCAAAQRLKNTAVNYENKTEKFLTLVAQKVLLQLQVFDRPH